MKKILLISGLVILCMAKVSAQFTSEGRPIIGNIGMPAPTKVTNRNAQNPKSCKSDTTTYPRFGTTGYYSVSVRTGSSLGQFFPVPQSMTISGFYFYAFSLATTPARPVNIKLRCVIYKAGADSLPTGSPLATDTVTVDTVMGASIPLARIMRKASFKSPVTLSSGGYIISVECDSTAVSAAVITNSWAAGDGKNQNIGCGSVSGKWYRCLNLNISSVRFDANMQYYPFVKYNFGTDFTVDNSCYVGADTVRFTNTNKTNVSGSVFYNYYIYYGLEYYSHRWTYDGSFAQYVVNGKYKPPVKKNFKTQLITTVYSYSSGQCLDTAEKMVYFKPVTPTTKKPTIGCRGDTVNIDINTDAGLTVNWYKSPFDTVPFFKGYSYSIKNVQKRDTFYVQVVNGPCKTPLARIEFVLNEYPNKPTVKNDSICSGAIANLSAKSNLGTIDWYESSSGGTAVFKGTDLQTGKLANDTQFYAEANNKGCINKGGRVLVKAFVGSAFAPDKPIVVGDTNICLRPIKAITIPASQAGNDTLRWFNLSTGGLPLAKGPSFTFTPSSRGDVEYYVETWNGVCGSGRSKVLVHVNDYPTIYGLRGDTICKGDTAFPYLSLLWGDANWYNKKADVIPIYTGQKIAVGGLKSDTKFYIETAEKGCFNAKRDSVLVNVNAPPVPTSVKSDPVCAKGIGSMVVNIPVGKVNWYLDSTDSLPFFVGNTVSTGLLLSNVKYYYSTENKGCASARVPLTVNIKPRPVAGFTWNLVWQNKLVCVPITTSGLTINWNWGDGNSQSGSPYNHTYANAGNYTVSMVATSTSNACKDTADIAVIINHLGTNTVNIGDLKIFPVPVKSGEKLNIQGINVSNLRVEIFASDGRKLAISMEVKGQIQLPENLSPGVYIVKIGDMMHSKSASILVVD